MSPSSVSQTRRWQLPISLVRADALSAVGSFLSVTAILIAPRSTLAWSLRSAASPRATSSSSAAARVSWSIKRERDRQCMGLIIGHRATPSQGSLARFEHQDLGRRPAEMRDHDEQAIELGRVERGPRHHRSVHRHEGLIASVRPLLIGEYLADAGGGINPASRGIVIHGIDPAA